MNQALAELYVRDMQFERALAIYVEVSSQLPTCSSIWQSRLYRVGISSQNTYSQLVSNLLLSSQSALLLMDRCWNVGRSPNGFWLNVYFLLKQLQKPYVFDFIQQHNLYAAIHDKVLSFTFPLAFTVLLSWRSYCHVLLIGLLAGSFYNCMTPMLASHCYPWWRGWSHTLWLTLIRLWLPIIVLLDFDLLELTQWLPSTCYFYFVDFSSQSHR